MKMLGFVVMGLLALLSLAAGGAKLAQAPQEVQFFNDLGLDAFWLYPLGALQVLAAVGCVTIKTRKAGIGAIAISFATSAAMIFATGNLAFGAVSVIPAALAVWLFFKTPGAPSQAI